MSHFAFDVREVTELPPAGRFAEHGYAVCLNDEDYYFFPHLEPAVVFGRAARMASTCGGYNVRQAARGSGDALYVLPHGTNVDRRPGEKRLFRRWIRGVDTFEAEWQVPTPLLLGRRFIGDHITRTRRIRWEKER